MKPIPLRIILLCAALGVIAAVAVNSMLVSSGGGEIVMSPVVIVVCLCMGGGACGWGFRWPAGAILKPRESENMNPVAAARVLAYAQGSILTGASLTGWMLGLLIYQLSLVSARGVTGVLWVTGANLVGAAALLAMGIWAQYLCRIPPDDPDGNSSSGGVEFG